MMMLVNSQAGFQVLHKLWRRLSKVKDAGHGIFFHF